MGCFLGCFAGSKDRRRRNQRNRGSPRRQRNGGQSPLQTTVSPVLGITEKVANSVAELSDKSEQQLSPSTRKRVTFDSNVQTYEHVTLYGSTDSILENNNNSERENEEDIAKSRQSYTNSEDDSTISSVGSYPQNHRYQNCRDSDDEAVESEYEDSDLDDEYDETVDESMLCQEIWSETIPTASTESRTDNSLTRVASQEVDSPITCGTPNKEIKTIGLNRNARDRSVYVHPVLNPVENLSQWKAVKSRGTLPLKPPQKENFAVDEEVPPRISFTSEPSFKQSLYSLNHQSNHQANNLNKDIAVDASLSNWLVSSEITPKEKTGTIGGSITFKKSLSQGSTFSVISIEDRPILGALTLEELKQFSASNSPRKSPSRIPDDMPIMGTVGTYWKHTGDAKNYGYASSYKGIPNTTSKYREDKKVNWNSIPFETRLERAWNGGAAEA